MTSKILSGLVVTTLSSSVGAQPGLIRITGAWELTIGPGEVAGPEGRRIAVERTVLPIPKQTVMSVQSERYPRLPLFVEKNAGWRRGTPLRALITQECTAAGALAPGSVTVCSAKGHAFVPEKDFRCDDFWGTIGRVADGKIGPRQVVRIDYNYYQNRLHAIAVSANGRVRLVEGEPAVGIQLPPELREGDLRLANIWLSGAVAELGDENLFVVDGTEPPTSEWRGTAPQFLPETLAKLRAGEPVRIVSWGDSVTHGGGVRGDRSKWYQHVFLKRLRKRFPKSEITLSTAAWPGGNSRGYMSAPAGGMYDFQRDVLDPKPDLVTIEFVNDAGWCGEKLNEHYGKILRSLRANGSEVIIITPHFTRPEWMGISKFKFDDDPRPYVRDLREFARRNRVAVADASLLWGHLWREGIPYMTLEGNSINHPDERGHRMFADALMEVFR